MSPERQADLLRRRAAALRAQADVDEELAADLDGARVAPAPPVLPRKAAAVRRARPYRPPPRDDTPVSPLAAKRAAEVLRREGIV